MAIALSPFLLIIAGCTELPNPVDTDKSTSDSLNLKTWNPVNNGITNQYITNLVVSRTSIFAGSSGSGAFLSTNQGVSWTSLRSVLPYDNIFEFGVSSTSIFAIAYYPAGPGLLVTEDGANWTLLNNGLEVAALMSIAVSDTNLYVGDAYGRIYHSANNGANWYGIGRLGDPEDFISNIVSELAVLGTTVFAVDGGIVYRSTNDGISWNILTNLNYADDSTGLPSGVRHLAVSGINLFAGTTGTGILMSTDKGVNWQAIGSGLPSNEIDAIFVTSSTLFAGTPKGIYYSGNNGMKWIALNEGLPRSTFDTSQYVHIQSFAVDERYLYAGSGGAGVLRLALDNITADAQEQ